uniref:Protein NRDE2 homolog n=1 Tax=Denticeps clupeoides TaxID=299321 RepID=A0AAY4B1D1_9TELE
MVNVLDYDWLIPLPPPPPADLQWLSNESFRSDDAYALHQHAADRAHQPGRGRMGKRRKRKKEKKKHKKHKKRSSERYDSDDSASKIIFPSDLLKQAEVALDPPVPGGKFVWLDEFQSTTEPPFCVYRKADAANWQYKSLYRGDIARYRRKGASCLGLDPRKQAVSWSEGGPGRKRSDRKSDRYYSTAVQQLLRSDGHPALPAPPDQRGGDSTGSLALFIPVPACLEESQCSAKPATSEVNPLGVYDPGTALWLEGKGQPPSKTEGEPREVDAVAARLKARVEEFNRKLREEPTDIHSWMEFIRFQDEMVAGAMGMAVQDDGGVGPKRVSARAVLERKLAVVERAVDSNPGSVELKLERLRLCRELWEPAALLKEWKKLVFLHPNSAALWRSYLLFAQSHFSTFSVSKVNSVYGKCLSTLASCLDGTMVSHPPLPNTEEDMLDIFLQQCHFLRQAGHSEKALSLFQGLLDFTFYKPDSVKELPTRQQVEFFETFWDSGEPRVGEKGARGWKAWMLQQERGGWVVPSEPDEEEEDEDEGSEVKNKAWPKWKVWLDVETTREFNHWLPWRPDKSKGQSEEDCEDPDRQVLFDEIGPSMIRVQRSDLQLRLICSFLQFLGFPAPPPASGHTLSSLLLDDLSIVQQGHDPNWPLTSCHLTPSGVSPLGHMIVLGGSQKQAGLCKAGEEFVQNTLAQLLPLLPVEDRSTVSLCWLRYEKLKVLRCVRGFGKKRLRSQGKRSKRLAKRLLKEAENRGRLDLWQEYAHLEWLLGNLEEARKVFDTALALGVSRGPRDPALCHLCLLYAQLEVEELWRVGGAVGPDSSPAINILSKLAEGATCHQVSPVTLLKARKSYEQALEASLARAEEGRGKSVAALAGCFALFQYLTVGVDAADAVYDRAARGLEEQRSSAAEFLSVQQAALLRHHTASAVLPLSRLRGTLTSALARFPSSAPPVAALPPDGDAVPQRRAGAPLLPRPHEGGAESSRRDVLPTLPESGLSNRICSLYEAAAATELGSRCPLLWRMYMKFLVSDGKVETARAIFYRALQNVPWVKGLYMDAVLLFPERVEEFLDLMTEKEVRLRAPMEEVEILLED